VGSAFIKHIGTNGVDEIDNFIKPIIA